MESVWVVGAGFAGTEAAWTLAEAGIDVTLFEMRPRQMTPAHTTGHFAELVCSNSLKSALPTSPAGQLKAEMTALGSVVLATAHEHRVPGGEALCVDRDAFGLAITARIRRHPRIRIEERVVSSEEVASRQRSGGITILATGPLTTEDLSQWLAARTGRAHLYFYDAVSPTVEATSINREIAFAQSRYDKGGADYLNCPMNREEYDAFVTALVSAERVPIHAFEAGGNRDATGDDLQEQFLEKVKYFAGCTPIEAIADKGARSLAFGNFKPVGLTDPRTGRRPHAAVQLRPENAEASLYSLVACQNRLRFGEQRRVFRMIPGLEKAEFVRYAVIHRNTYLDAPRVLSADLELRDTPGVYVAGQLTGVEGYVESAAMGIYVGKVVAGRLLGRTVARPPRETAYGGLLSHLQDETPREFAPMNVNWGLFPNPGLKKKDESRAARIAAAQLGLEKWQAEGIL